MDMLQHANTEARGARGEEFCGRSALAVQPARMQSTSRRSARGSVLRVRLLSAGGANRSEPNRRQKRAGRTCSPARECKQFASSFGEFLASLKAGGDGKPQANRFRDRKGDSVRKNIPQKHRGGYPSHAERRTAEAHTGTTSSSACDGPHVRGYAQKPRSKRARLFAMAHT